MNSSNVEQIMRAGYVEIGEVKLYSFVIQTEKRLITATDVFKAVRDNGAALGTFR